MSRIPSEEECLRLLREAGASERVIRHTCTVMVLANEIARRCLANEELVRAGALLHDIGRSRTHSVMHPVVGGEIAKQKGLPEEIIKIIHRHIGSGLTDEEARKLGYPPGHYLPETVEEKIVCISDKLVGGTDYQTSQRSYQEFLDRGLTSSGERMLRLYREISDRAGIELDRLIKEIDPAKEIGPCSRMLGNNTI